MISEFPLWVFTTLAGMAAGAYIVDAVFRRKAAEGTENDNAKIWVFPLATLILLGLGLLGCLGHLGRPLMFLNALSNPGAMIAQEAYWSIAFGIVLLIDLVLCFVKQQRFIALQIIGSIAAAGLIVVMSNAYFTTYGVPAWTNVLTWPVFVVGDLAMGIALVAAMRADTAGNAAFSTTLLLLEALAAVTFIAEAVSFAGLGLSSVLLWIGAVLCAVAVSLGMMQKMGKLPAKYGAVAILAVTFLGIALARYGFYAASPF